MMKVSFELKLTNISGHQRTFIVWKLWEIEIFWERDYYYVT